MALIEFSPVKHKQGATTNAFERSFSQEGVGASDYLLVPPVVNNISFDVILDAAGSASFQYTNSSQADVDADTAEWKDSPQGVVTAGFGDAMRPVTAIRLNVITGNWTVKLRAQ